MQICYLKLFPAAMKIKFHNCTYALSHAPVSSGKKKTNNKPKTTTNPYKPPDNSKFPRKELRYFF